MEKKIDYNMFIGLKKALKNVIVTVVVPATIVLLNSYNEWMPEEWYPIAVPIMSIISYMVKNKVEFK